MALPPGPTYPAALQTLFYLVRPTAFIEHNTKRYGDLYTLRSSVLGNQVMVGDPELVKQVFTGDPDVLRAGEVNAPATSIFGERSIMVLDGEAHLRERRRMMPAFHGERMHAYAAAMREETLRAVAGWREGEAISLLPSMQRITIQIIFRTVFGLAEGARHDELRDKLAGMLQALTGPAGMFLVMPAMQRDLGPLTPWATFVRLRTRLFELIDAEVDRRREALAAGEHREDVLSLMLSVRDEAGRGMTNEEIRDELITLLGAGYDTTATALCWVFEQILGRPEVLARLRADIDAADIERPEQLGRLDYLDATIKEALRLRPVIPTVVRKTKAKVTLRGHDIPADTLVFPAIYAIHRRPDIYPEPEAFRPERFLGKKPDPYTWFPFGGGVRRCIGMAFALYEMRIVVATVLSRVELRLKKPAPLRVVLRSFFFAPEGGAPVVVGRRRPPRGGDAKAS